MTQSDPTSVAPTATSAPYTTPLQESVKGKGVLVDGRNGRTNSYRSVCPLRPLRPQVSTNSFTPNYVMGLIVYREPQGEQGTHFTTTHSANRAPTTRFLHEMYVFCGGAGGVAAADRREADHG